MFHSHVETEWLLIRCFRAALLHLRYFYHYCNRKLVNNRSIFRVQWRRIGKAKEKIHTNCPPQILNDKFLHEKQRSKSKRVASVANKPSPLSFSAAKRSPALSRCDTSISTVALEWPQFVSNMSVGLPSGRRYSNCSLATSSVVFPRLSAATECSQVSRSINQSMVYFFWQHNCWISTVS